MSLLRYFNEQGEQHRGNLFWSGSLGGLPFRGTGAPLLTQEELDEKVVITGDFHCERFDLTDADQKAKYQDIMSRIENGWYVLRHIDRSESMVRVVEWLQRYGELSPTARAPGSILHVNGNGKY